MSIRELYPSDVPEVVDVVSDSFADYPVMKFVLQHGREGYETRLQRFCHFIAMARVHRSEFMYGVRDTDRLQGVALVSLPNRSVKSHALEQLRDELWRDLGDGPRERYAAYTGAVEPFMPREHHYHINVLAVRSDAQGRGYARALLDHVHTMAQRDAESSGVSLTTEKESNVSLYEHFGYRVLGQTTVAPELMAWGFFRPRPGL